MTLAKHPVITRNVSEKTSRPQAICEEKASKSQATGRLLVNLLHRHERKASAEGLAGCQACVVTHAQKGSVQHAAVDGVLRVGPAAVVDSSCRAVAHDQRAGNRYQPVRAVAAAGCADNARAVITSNLSKRISRAPDD